MTEIVKPQPAVFDVASTFHQDTNGLVLEHRQEIHDEFLAQLRGMKADSGSVREKEFMHVASIPVVIHEKWLREGYDCTKEPVRETVKKLRNEQMDAFIVTNKSI